MKKLLALVLALVMVMGLSVVSTNAAYKDADSINYKEAVDVMSAIGVLKGDENGFRPGDTLKRSEGAKIIAYLMLGNTAAEGITGTGAKFSDVPASHWAVGYIEYLTSVGVISGVGGGKFDPDGALTTNAFAKMLLTALGYDAKIEGLVGNDWAINTQKLATQLSLFKGNSNAVGSAAITREQAALYSLNTIKSPLVKYETKGTTVTVGDAKVETGASNWSYMTTTSSEAQYRNIDDARVNGTGALIVEFAEQYYPKLKLADGGTDDFGRPANVWTLSGKDVGTYTKASDLQYTAAVEMGKIYSDLGLTATIEPANITIMEDGVLARDYDVIDGAGDHSAWNVLRLVKGSTEEIGGNGALTEVYFDDDDKTVEIYVINTYFAKVEAAYAATSSKDAYVTLGTIANTTNTGIGSKYDTADFKAGDYVLYTYSYADGGSVQSMETADAVQGKLTGYQVGKNVNIGETVKSNTIAASKATINDGLQNAINTTVTVFKDKNGYAVAVDAEAASDAYAVVLGWTGNDSVGNSTRSVNLLFADGTKKSVVTNGIYKTGGTNALTVETNDTAAGNITTDRLNIGDIVSYRVNSKDEYKLTLLADTQKVGNGVAVTTKNSSTITALNTLTKASGKTVFALYNSTKGSVNIYEGIANVPTVTTADGNHRATAYQKGATGYADFVWIDVATATVTNSSKDVIFIKGDTSGAKYDEKFGTYYEYDAVINDEITTIKLDGAVTKWTIATDVTKDSDGIYDKSTLTTSVDNTTKTAGFNANDGGGTPVVYYAVGTDAAKNSTIYFGSQYFSVANNPKVFRVATDGTISESTLGAIQKDTNDQVFWKMTDDLATTIIVRTVDDTVTTGNEEVVDATKPAGEGVDADKMVVDVVTIDPADDAANLVQVRNAVSKALNADGYTDIVVSGLTGATVTGVTTGSVEAKKDGAPVTFSVTYTVNYTVTVDGKVVEYVVKGADAKTTDTNIDGAKPATNAGTGYISNAATSGTFVYAAYGTTGATVKANVAAPVVIKTGYVSVAAGTHGYGTNSVTGSTPTIPTYAQAGSTFTVSFATTANGGATKAVASATVTCTGATVSTNAQTMTLDEVKAGKTLSYTIATANTNVTNLLITFVDAT